MYQVLYSTFLTMCTTHRHIQKSGVWYWAPRLILLTLLYFNITRFGVSTNSVARGVFICRENSLVRSIEGHWNHDFLRSLAIVCQTLTSTCIIDHIGWQQVECTQICPTYAKRSVPALESNQSIPESTRAQALPHETYYVYFRLHPFHSLRNTCTLPTEIDLAVNE